MAVQMAMLQKALTYKYGTSVQDKKKSTALTNTYVLQRVVLEKIMFTMMLKSKRQHNFPNNQHTKTNEHGK